MIAKIVGIESKLLATSGELPRRASCGEPTLVTQGMAAPRDLVVRSAPIRAAPFGEPVAPLGAAAKPAFSAAAAGASRLR